MLPSLGSQKLQITSPNIAVLSSFRTLKPLSCEAHSQLASYTDDGKIEE